MKPVNCRSSFTESERRNTRISFFNIIRENPFNCWFCLKYHLAQKGTASQSEVFGQFSFRCALTHGVQDREERNSRGEKFSSRDLSGGASRAIHQITSKGPSLSSSWKTSAKLTKYAQPLCVVYTAAREECHVTHAQVSERELCKCKRSAQNQ